MLRSLQKSRLKKRKRRMLRKDRLRYLRRR